MTENRLQITHYYCFHVTQLYAKDFWQRDQFDTT